MLEILLGIILEKITYIEIHFQLKFIETIRKFLYLQQINVMPVFFSLQNSFS